MKSRQKDDWYPTPDSATKALLAVEVFDPYIWEPAAGDGALAEVLKADDYGVVASDLNDYGYCESGIDFLMATNLACDSLITNPPYKFANQFVVKCLDLEVPYFAMLLRLAFLEGKQRRETIYNRQAPARVHAFSERLTMWRGDEEQPEGTSGFIAFAWFVWEQGKTDTKLDWI